MSNAPKPGAGVTRHGATVEWQATVRTCDMAGGALDPERIAEAIAASRRADAVGPVLDPTLWMRARERHDACCALLAAAQSFAEAHRRFREAMEAEARHVAA